MNSLIRLRWEKETLENSLIAYQEYRKRVDDVKVKKSLKFQIEMIKVRLDEYYRILSILNIKI